MDLLKIRLRISIIKIYRSFLIEAKIDMKMSTQNTVEKPNNPYEVIQDTEAQRTLHLTEQTDSVSVFFVRNACLDLQIYADIPETHGEVFVLVPAISHSESTVKVHADISASNVHLDVHLISLQAQGAHVQMQGAIHISKDVHHVEAHLLEDAVLLDGAKYTALQPILQVESPDVKASHGAKVHRISSEHLFYLQSKGLSLEAAQQLILESYGNMIMGKVQGFDFHDLLFSPESST